MRPIATRALKRLAAPGARLAPWRNGMAGVFKGADRRRRPLAQLSRQDVETLAQSGLIAPAETIEAAASAESAAPGGSGEYAITSEGRAFLERSDDPAAASPCQPSAERRRHGAVAAARGRAGAGAGAHYDFESGDIRARLQLWDSRAEAPVFRRVHFDVAAQLARDHELGRRAPSVTMRWEPVAARRAQGRAPSGPFDASVSSLAARDRVARALREAGPRLAPLLELVVLEEQGLGESERAAGWKKGDGRLALAKGLERAARAYGLSEEPLGRLPRSARYGPGPGAPEIKASASPPPLGYV